MTQPQTQPQTQTVQPTQPPPASVPLIVRVAEILLAAWAIGKTADAIAALLQGAFAVLRPPLKAPSSEAVTAALGLANSAHTPRPRLRVNGFDASTAAATAVMRFSANDDLYYRAAYVLNAAKRIQASIDGGASVKEAVGAEARHYEAHRKARENRLAVAGVVGKAAELFGPLLGWYRNELSDSDAECIAADGHNFYAARPPLIGYPGAAHLECACVPGPPHAGAGMVDDAVAALQGSAVRVPLRRAS